MPYILWKKHGKRVKFPFVLTEEEAERLSSKESGCVFINITSRRTKRFHISKKRKRK